MLLVHNIHYGAVKKDLDRIVQEREIIDQNSIPKKPFLVNHALICTACDLANRLKLDNLFSIVKMKKTLKFAIFMH